MAMPLVRPDWRWQPERELSESIQVSIPDLLAPSPARFDLFKLVKADGRLQIHHIIFKAALDHLVVLVALIAKAFPRIFAHPMQPKHFDSRRILFPPGQD